MAFHNKKKVVVIVGADHPTGLGVARAVHDKKCWIVGLYNTSSPCCKSKYWDVLIHIDSYDEMVEVLIKYQSNKKEKAALFVASDNAVKLVSEHRDKLKSYYSFLLPEKQIVNCFLDKAEFHQWASNNSFKVPVSYICSSNKELEECLKSAPFPVVVKPFEKTVKWNKMSPIHKAFWLKGENDLEKIHFDLFSCASKVIVQQWIPGGDRNVYFCLVAYDKCGNKIADYTGRKFFQWPILNGSTAAAIGEHNIEVSQTAEKIFNLVKYQGLGSIEFKKSDLDGQFYLIEPTVGRCDFQSNLALAGGVNLADMALSEMFGLNISKSRRKSAVWIHEEGFIDSIRAWYRVGSLRKKDLLHLLKPNVYFSYLSILDPKPGLELIKNKSLKKKYRDQ